LRKKWSQQTNETDKKTYARMQKYLAEKDVGKHAGPAQAANNPVGPQYPAM